jgi:hypothetical protein
MTTARPEWPSGYLRIALQFLALDNEAKRQWLPAPFPTTLFHMREGDSELSDPLRFMALFCADLTYGSVSSLQLPDDAERDRILREITAVLDVMWFSRNEYIWDLAFIAEQRAMPWSFIWEAVGRSARLALDRLAWPVAPPEYSCVLLLDEYSYGAYSAALERR